MSKNLESYVSFIQQHHLSKVTKYFVKKTISDSFIVTKNGHDEKDELSDEFKNLLKSIQKNTLLKESSDEIKKFKKEIKDAAINDNQFASKYISFLKGNKNALIHFIPLYSNDLESSVELMEEIEKLFSKLELNVIDLLNVTMNAKTKKPDEYFLNKTKKKLQKTTVELQLSQNQLLETQHIANVGSFIWDIESNEITASDELYRIYHTDPNEKVALEKFEGYLDENSKKQFKINLKKALSKPAVFESEYRILLPGNEEKYINIRSKSIQNNKGKTIQILGVIMDITSIKKAQLELDKKNKEINETNLKLKEAQKELELNNRELDKKIKISTRELKESNERYLEFIKLSSEGIWRYELKNIDSVDITLSTEEQIELLLKHAYFAECNDKMAKLHGYQKAEELTGQFFSETKSMHTIEDKKKFLERFIQSGYRVTNYEAKGKYASGKPRYLKGSVFGVIEDNKLISAWGIQRDVTEETETEHSLKQSEEKYRFLAENLPIIFWTANPDGYLDYGNQNWFEYTGSKPEQYKAIDWKNFIHPDDLKRTQKAWINSITTGKEYQTEYRLKDANGNYRWHMGRSYPHKDEDGNVIKWMGTSIDIHDQKLYSDKLDNKNKELNKINNELDNLIYTVSHDLKSPVANIEGLITALKDSLPKECSVDKNSNDIMNMMNDSIEKFKTNLMEVINLAKAQKRGEETAEKNKLKDIVEEVKPDLNILMQNAEIKIETDFEKCQYIYFNRKNLRSVLYNLISNAVKYSSPDRIPKISISSKKTRKYNILTVEDNGKGFDHHHIDDLTSKRLFKEIEGSGVGLYIMKRIMDNAGGKIEIDSQKGVGSRFTIYFPNEKNSNN